MQYGLLEVGKPTAIDLKKLSLIGEGDAVSYTAWPIVGRHVYGLTLNVIS